MYYSTVLVTHTTHKHISPYARSRRIYDTGHSRGYQGKVFNSPSALVSSLLCSPLLSSPLVYRLHVCVTVNCMCASQIACIRQGLHVCASQRGTAGTAGAAAAVMDGGPSVQAVASHRCCSYISAGQQREAPQKRAARAAEEKVCSIEAG